MGKLTRLPRARSALAAVAAAGLLTAGLAAGTASSAGAEPGPAVESSLPSGWTARGEQHDGVATHTDVKVPMSDGTVLRADVRRPADADGTPVEGRFPVLVTITAYNKQAVSRGGGGDLAGAPPDYFVKRGYVHVTVDARGTGSSQGSWAAFSERENADAGEIVEWAASSERAWSDGRVGMNGASYMGISQLFAASHRPEGLKAIFPQVPAADVYRDVVASGGQIDVGFIPLWLSLVTAAGLIPPAYGQEDPAAGFDMYRDRLNGGTQFTLPTALDAMAGGDAAYDGPFYAERSPINVVDEVDVPTFLVGGEYDLFQRGTPLLYEALRERGVPVKMILGPWDHIQGSSGAEIADAGYGSLAELQLRWFDHHVMERPDPALDSDIPPLTYYEINGDRWVQGDEWVGDDTEARSFRLSGSSGLLSEASLTEGAAQAGKSRILPVPVSGLCTRSASQWTAGMPNQVGFAKLCEDNALNDRTGVVFDSQPMTEPLRIRGPINARLYASSLSGDGMLSAHVSSVAPDGTVDRLTGGWQVISHRALDEERTRYVDGKVLQPYHPFTKEAQEDLAGGEVAPVDVEVFPTGAVIPEGHRLRLSVQAFDVPHLAPPVNELLDTLTVITLHNSERYPSELTVPAVGTQ